MEFRTLTGSDLGSLVELYQQLDPKDGLSAEACEAAWKEIEKNPDIRYFGAVEDGKVVSTCYAVIIPNLTRGCRGICFIENVLGSRVIGMAVGFAKERRCYKVILQSGKARTEAHRFYERIGFDGESKKAFDMRLE